MCTYFGFRLRQSLINSFASSETPSNSSAGKSRGADVILRRVSWSVSPVKILWTFHPKTDDYDLASKRWEPREQDIGQHSQWPYVRSQTDRLISQNLGGWKTGIKYWYKIAQEVQYYQHNPESRWFPGSARAPGWPWRPLGHTAWSHSLETHSSAQYSEAGHEKALNWIKIWASSLI